MVTESLQHLAWAKPDELPRLRTHKNSEVADERVFTRTISLGLYNIHKFNYVYNQTHWAAFNPLMGTLKPQSNGGLHNNTVIGTLAVDGWAVTFGTARGAWAGCGPPSTLLAVPKVTAHPSTASVPTLCYSMWHYNWLRTIKVKSTYRYDTCNLVT